MYYIRVMGPQMSVTKKSHVCEMTNMRNEPPLNYWTKPVKKNDNWILRHWKSQ